MGFFSRNTGNVAILRLEEEKRDLMATIAFYKARLAAVENRAYKIHKGEAYYCIQGKNGKFTKMQLPAVGKDGK